MSAYSKGIRVPEDDDAEGQQRPVQYMDVDALDTQITDTE